MMSGYCSEALARSTEIRPTMAGATGATGATGAGAATGSDGRQSFLGRGALRIWCAMFLPDVTDDLCILPVVAAKIDMSKFAI